MIYGDQGMTLKKLTPSELYLRSDRRLSAKLVPTFEIEGAT
jgi:hypothetical protein